jgi:hypothetical protein
VLHRLVTFDDFVSPGDGITRADAWRRRSNPEFEIFGSIVVAHTIAMVDRFALDQTGCIRRTRSPTPNGVPKLAPSLPPRWPYCFLKPQPGGIQDERQDRSHSSSSLQDRTTARSSRHRGCSRHRSCGLRVREWCFEWRTIHDNDALGGTFGWRLNEWKRRCRLLITSDTLDNGVNNDAARRPERRRLARLVERDRCGTRVWPSVRRALAG